MMEDNHDLGPTSGDTVEFTPSELEEGLRRVRAPHPSSNDGGNPHPISGHVRILLKAALTPVALDLLPRGIIQNPVRGERSFILDGNAHTEGGNHVRKFAIAQSSNDIGYDIKAALLGPKRSGQESTVMRCRIYFDPAQDRVVVTSYSPGTIALRKLGDTSAIFSSRSHQEFNLEIGVPKTLDPGCWSVFTSSRLHIMDLSVLRRRGLISEAGMNTGGENQAQIGTKSSGKRPLGSPQTTNERAKVREIENADGAVIVFQATPNSAASSPNKTHESTSSHTIPTICHPLEQLSDGEVAKVVGSKGEDYTLTRGKSLMVNRNSMVFRASHSRIPLEMIVVKVVRTPESSEGLDGANGLINTAELWLKEVKNHSMLKQHVRTFSNYSLMLSKVVNQRL